MVQSWAFPGEACRAGRSNSRAVSNSLFCNAAAIWPNWLGVLGKGTAEESDRDKNENSFRIGRSMRSSLIYTPSDGSVGSGQSCPHVFDVPWTLPVQDVAASASYARKRTNSKAADDECPPHTIESRPASIEVGRLSGSVVEPLKKTSCLPVARYLGMRAAVALPKFPSSKLKLTFDRFARLKRLKTSNRNWKFTLSVMRVFL